MKALLLALFLFPAVGHAETLELDPSTGSFHVILRKEGLLKRFAHDHVVEARDYKGAIELWTSSAALRLDIPADKLEIDLAPARREEGFLSEVSPRDHEKILKSMRGEKGLDVARFPLIGYQSDKIEPVEGEPGMWMVSGHFLLHGVASPMDLPVTMTARPGGYWVSGYVRLRPSDYGIQPFSAAGGMIAVQDEAMVRFNLAAVKR